MRVKFSVYLYNFKLFDFIDELSDLSCLVYQKNSQTYLPYNKDWVKEKIYILLRNQAGKNWLPNSFYALNLIISKISAVLFNVSRFRFLGRLLALKYISPFLWKIFKAILKLLIEAAV